MGYVGLPLALLFSGEGFPITAFDIDATKVETLANGGSYIVRSSQPRSRGLVSGAFRPLRTMLASPIRMS